MVDDGRLAELMVAMGRGDRAAAAELYRALGGRIFGICHRILRDTGLAEDAAQEAFLKVWKAADRFDPAKGEVAAWVAVVARRTALDRRPRVMAELPPDLEAPPLDEAYVHPRLRECLAELPETHRNALVLMYVYGLTHSELAEAMDAPLGTVKSWVRRASAALKETLTR
jgi:RNA polymerase sigma-70 factor (ECF subfamily)